MLVTATCNFHDLSTSFVSIVHIWNSLHREAALVHRPHTLAQSALHRSCLQDVENRSQPQGAGNSLSLSLSFFRQGYGVRALPLSLSLSWA